MILGMMTLMNSRSGSLSKTLFKLLLDIQLPQLDVHGLWVQENQGQIHHLFLDEKVVENLDEVQFLALELGLLLVLLELFPQLFHGQEQLFELLFLGNDQLETRVYFPLQLLVFDGELRLLDRLQEDLALEEALQLRNFLGERGAFLVQGFVFLLRLLHSSLYLLQLSVFFDRFLNDFEELGLLEMNLLIFHI